MNCNLTNLTAFPKINPINLGAVHLFYPLLPRSSIELHSRIRGHFQATLLRNRHWAGWTSWSPWRSKVSMHRLGWLSSLIFVASLVWALMASSNIADKSVQAAAFRGSSSTAPSFPGHSTRVEVLLLCCCAGALYYEPL